MDKITRHVIERMAERLKRTIDGEGYNALCQAAHKGFVVERKTTSSKRVFRFQRKWLLAVYDEQKCRVVTCWRPHKKIIEKARLAS
ncbi:hypothetical protein N6H05_18695 [Sphingobium sp. WTD-1]|uniref:hypothetical protein n=1 Tax=Sphingobium sp. WTD-1 TaxID=2979467 RepID=UPI0024DF02BD|nr:hypothetical protein [Sphingobium sp. WTD-1]WIA55046.1 hypothetical protein N6H05_18695 [Sphingobium sp. WTD-1]